MPTFNCPQCSFQIEAPAGSGGTRGRCPSCQQLVEIPADDPFEMATRDLAVLAPIHEQWFVFLPDGRQHGPVTRQQIEEAMRVRQLPPQGFVRRGDWPTPMPAQQALAQPPPQAIVPQYAHAFAVSAPPAERPVYWDQLSRDPVGTIVFGPQLPAYQSHASVDERTERQRFFNLWLFGWLGVMVLSLLIALGGGTLVGGPSLGLGGTVFLVTIMIWPALFYASGLWCFGGAYLEWELFMNARRVRSMRAAYRQESVRKFYMGMGMFFMIPSGLVHIGLLLATVCAVCVIGVAPAAVTPNKILTPVEAVERDRRKTEGERLESLLADLKVNLDAEHVKAAAELDKANLWRRKPDTGILSDYLSAYDNWRMNLEYVESQGRQNDVPSYTTHAAQRQQEAVILQQVERYFPNRSLKTNRLR